MVCEKSPSLKTPVSSSASMQNFQTYLYHSNTRLFDIAFICRVHKIYRPKSRTAQKSPIIRASVDLPRVHIRYNP